MKNRTVALKGAVIKPVRSRWLFLLAATLLTGILVAAPMACVSEPAPSPNQSDGPAPMGPQEAVSAATKLAQWPAIPQFSTMTGDPSAAAGAVLAYGEAWKYYSDGAMHRNDLPLADDLVWLVIFEGEIYGKCDQPGCSHAVGPWPDWPKRVEDDEWKQPLVVMDAVTGELMMRSVYHEGRLRSTEGAGGPVGLLGTGVVLYAPLRALAEPAEMSDHHVRDIPHGADQIPNPSPLVDRRSARLW